MTITQPDGTKAVIKAPPTRIATVGNPSIAMDNVLALGVKPVGGEVFPASAVDQDSYDARGIPREIAGEITSFTAVGIAPNKPDLEKIVALHPDLIVGVNGKSTGDLKQLEAIAPVESPMGDTPPTGTGVDSLESVAQVRLLGTILDAKPRPTRSSRNSIAPQQRSGRRSRARPSIWSARLPMPAAISGSAPTRSPAGTSSPSPG